jgi:hypothetical protein
MDLPSILKLLAPMFQQGFDKELYPLILLEIGKIPNPAVVAILSALLPSVKAMIDAELAKLSV